MDIYRIKDDELYHHGIKGMKWGVRRFQNRDGSLTKEGMARYADKVNKDFVKARKEYLEANKYAREGRARYDEDPEYMPGDENKAFKRALKDAGIKYDADTLDLGAGQIYLLNRGINPNKYAEKIKEKQDKYRKIAMKYYDKPVTDKKNILGEKMTHESIYLMDMKPDAGLWDTEGLKGAYKEDNEIFEKIAKSAKKYLDENGEPYEYGTGAGLSGMKWGARK